MADLTKLRNIFNINPRISDDDILDALESAGYVEKGSGFRNSRSSIDYTEALGPLEKQKEYRRLINEAIEEEIRLEEELQQLKEQGASQDEIREKQAELAAAKRDTDYLKQRKQADGITASIKKIYDSVANVISAVQKLNDPWANADAAASKYAKTVGLVQKGMEALRKQTIENVARGRIGINYNTSAQELLELQSNYAKAAGRNIRLSNEDQENLAAVNFATQGLGTELLPEFEKMGVFLSDASSHIGKMYAQASKEGISLERYAKNVQQGLAMAQTYNFKNGLKGMEEMAKRAAAIRMDMSQIQSFANSFDTIEKSITNAAKLQVLGGPFAAAADPLGMLHDSLMGVEDTQKRMEQIIANIGVYDRKTGEAYTSAFDKQRLKAYAEATGQDFNKVMENVNRNIVVKEIRSQINSSAHASGLNEDIKKLIENSGEIREGKAGVSINGEFKTIDELENEDKDLLVRETKSQSEDIKDIARDVRSLKDMREGFVKQREAVQARFSERTGAGQGEKGATGWLGGQNWFHGILNSLTTLFSFTTAIGTLRGRGGGRLFKAIRRRGLTAPVTSSPSTIAANIKGGKQIISSAGKSYSQVGTKVFNSAGKEIFGGAKSAVTKGAVDAGKASIGRRGAGRLATRTAIKVGGKSAAKIGTKLAAGAAKGAGVGIIGAAGNIATDALVASGKIKEGGGAHMAMKAGSSALEGAAMGMMLGSVIPGVGNAVGAAIGAVAGAAIGVVKVQKVRNEKLVDSQLQKLGIERKGNYSVGRLSDIDKALQTGKMSNSLRKKLLREGDTDIVNQINAVADKREADKEAKKEKRQEREERRAEAKKNRFNTATFEIGTAYISPISIKGGKPEDGKSGHLSVMEKMRWRAEKEGNENGRSNNGPIEVKIDGKIELKTPNGQSFDIMAEIKKDPALLRKLTQEIIKEMNVQKYGGYKSSRTLGNNIPTANA